MKRKTLRVLVGCEFSGVVREAFNAYSGIEAFSCDLLPCEDGREDYHRQQDVMEVIAEGWDLAILHPECTAMSLSGNAHYGEGMSKNHLRQSALNWTEALWKLAKQKCTHVALEQPMSMLRSRLGKRMQEIHPWQFGHPEQKTTWLWLHRLPRLDPTRNVYAEMMRLPRKQRERIFFMGGGNGHERSITFTGIAQAMAAQWIPVMIGHLKKPVRAFEQPSLF